MKTHVFRLTSGEDLKQSIEKYVCDNGIRAGYILSCVGGLSQVRLRLPGAEHFIDMTSPVEIVSVQGTLSSSGCHLHAAISDGEGRVIGGHLSVGCIVRLTSEIVLAADTAYEFTRRFDQATGYRELVVRRSRRSRVLRKRLVPTA